MYVTPRVNWTPDNGIAISDLNRIEGNIKAINELQVSSGNGTDIILEMESIADLGNNTIVNFIANANNGGLSTEINNVPLYKPGTANPPTITKDRAYTAWYNKTGNCFFLKASAEGNALAKDVRTGTTFSNGDDTAIPGGLDLSLLASGNIRAGITIDGITGKSSVVDTANATATQATILNGYSAYINGSKVTGNMPYYNNGAHVNALDKTAGVLSPNDGNNYAYVKPAAGYYDGNAWAKIYQPQLTPANILNGINIMGIIGQATVASLGGAKVHVGTAVHTKTNGVYSVTIPGIPFTPKFGFLFYVGDPSVAVFYDTRVAEHNTRYLYGCIHSSNIAIWGARWTNANFSNGVWQNTFDYPPTIERSDFSNVVFDYIFISY